MIILLIKLIFFSISTITNLVSRLILTSTAFLIILIINGLKVPGEAAQGALESVGEALKTCFEFVLDLVIEIISSIISSAFDLVKDSAMGSASMAGSAIGGLIEQTRTSLDELVKEVPDLPGEVWNLVSTLVTDLWSNYKSAVEYVTENAKS